MTDAPDNPAAMAIKARGTPIEIVVVAKRCIYINDYRVAGAKPWVSENLPQHSFNVTLGDIIDALPRKQLLAMLAARKAKP